MSSSRNQSVVSLEPKSRAKEQASVIFLFALLITFTYFSFSYIQPHRDLDSLQTVTGQVQNIRVTNNHRAPHRPALTRFLVNDTWYEVHGRYDLDYLRQHSEQVDLRVDGTNIWVLQTRQSTLISYDTSARQYQRQRRIEFAVLVLVAFFFFALVVFQIKLLSKGNNPFSSKKD